jgi:hypothetical protein
MSKRENGQFYTTNAKYILQDLWETNPPTKDVSHIIEPFAGQGDLLEWLVEQKNTLPVIAYDIEPKRDDIIFRDTLENPPDYKGTWVITNPPYFARNKNDNKSIYDKYETNDLYKCFIYSLIDCAGGIIIIPAGFFFSPRKIDIRCREIFLSRYKVFAVRYFEETVFKDTNTTVVAISFKRSEIKLENQDITWHIMPLDIQKTFRLNTKSGWIIGGCIYNLQICKDLSIKRYVSDIKVKDGEQLTSMTLNALDSGTMSGRIRLEYKLGYVYPAKNCSRTFATLIVSGRTLSEDEQINACAEFNQYLEQEREKYHSLFLPQYRESKLYARKRIPFELAYRILNHVFSSQLKYPFKSPMYIRDEIDE